jgi:hypothetical protein
MIKKQRSKFLLIALIILPGCSNPKSSLTTSTISTQFATLDEKITFIQKYLKVNRAYQDLDFVINYNDNSGGMIPGPGDWDIRVIAKVPAAEIVLWTSGLDPIKSANSAWVKTLPARIDYTGVSSWYKARGANLLLGVDPKNAVIVYWHTTQAQIN